MIKDGRAVPWAQNWDCPWSKDRGVIGIICKQTWQPLSGPWSPRPAEFQVIMSHKWALCCADPSQALGTMWKWVWIPACRIPSVRVDQSLNLPTPQIPHRWVLRKTTTPSDTVGVVWDSVSGALVQSWHMTQDSTYPRGIIFHGKEGERWKHQA